MTLSGCFSYLLVLVFFNLTTKRLCAYFFLFILIRIWWICYLWDLWFINSGKFSAIQMPLPYTHYYFLLEIWLYVLDLITVFPVALKCFLYPVSLYHILSSSAAQSYSSLDSSMSNLSLFMLCAFLFRQLDFSFPEVLLFSILHNY